MDQSWRFASFSQKKKDLKIEEIGTLNNTENETDVNTGKLDIESENSGDLNGLTIQDQLTPFGDLESIWLAQANKNLNFISNEIHNCLLIDAPEYTSFFHFMNPENMISLKNTSLYNFHFRATNPYINSSKIFQYEDNPESDLLDFVLYAGIFDVFDDVFASTFSDTLDKISENGNVILEFRGAIFDDNLAKAVFLLSKIFKKANLFIPFGSDGRVFLILQSYNYDHRFTPIFDHQYIACSLVEEEKPEVWMGEKIGTSSNDKENLNFYDVIPSDAFIIKWNNFIVEFHDYNDQLRKLYGDPEFEAIKFNFKGLLSFLKLPRIQKRPFGIHQKQLIDSVDYGINYGLPFYEAIFKGFPKLEYRERPEEVKTILHWGQRKLMISEFQFLMKVMDSDEENIIVVYIGAASCEHIGILIHLLEGTGRNPKFVLYDPRPFEINTKILGALALRNEKIIVRNEFYTDKTHEKLRKEFPTERFLFISDIRREAKDEMIVEDMENQKKWYKNLIQDRENPAGLFKFRLLWNDEKTKYLKGDILFPVWGGATTTECRLLVQGDGNEEIEYDNRTHEQQMFYFNSIYRTGFHVHNVEGYEYDQCYDCRAEIQVLTDILFQTMVETTEDFQKAVGDVSYMKNKKKVTEKPINIVWSIIEKLDLVDGISKEKLLLTDNEIIMENFPDIVGNLGIALNKECSDYRTLLSGYGFKQKENRKFIEDSKSRPAIPSKLKIVRTYRGKT